MGGVDNNRCRFVGENHSRLVAGGGTLRKDHVRHTEAEQNHLAKNALACGRSNQVRRCCPPVTVSFFNFTAASDHFHAFTHESTRSVLCSRSSARKGLFIETGCIHTPGWNQLRRGAPLKDPPAPPLLRRKSRSRSTRLCANIRSLASTVACRTQPVGSLASAKRFGRKGRITVSVTNRTAHDASLDTKTLLHTGGEREEGVTLNQASLR